MEIFSNSCEEERIERSLSNLIAHSRYSENRPCSYWRKSRIAARLILRSAQNKKLSPRDLRLIQWVLEDDGVTDRLIDQAQAYLTAPKKTYARGKSILGT